MARKNPNPVASYEWLVPAKNNPAVGLQEAVVVVGVGTVLGLVGQKVTTPAILGAGLYTLGYFANQQGWLTKYTK